jgi:DNA invertase Pin-like site-specific DNA recombinase
MTRRAFSYIRFSDSKLAKGDSRRRQLEWGTAQCAKHGWVLDESLHLRDYGVSALHGDNAVTGALGGFLRAIKERKVRAGDLLLVESLDRLTREDIDPAWELFRSILKAGVEIYTREPERHYIPADLNNFGTRIEVQAYFLRAYNESATKAMRGRAYWEGQRTKLAAEKRPVHKVLPAWLRLSADRKQIEVIPEAAEAVRLIYRWAREGLGIEPITARLNAQGIPPIGNNIRKEVFKTTWARSYVAKLLQGREVLGEFQPHVMKRVPVDLQQPDGPTRWKRVPHGEPVKGYFPAVVTEDEYNLTRQAVKGRGKEVGPQGVGVANLFTALIRDARDGETMQLTYAGSSRKNNTRVLLSYGVRNGKPGAVYLPFPYDPIEIAFLESVRELKAADVTGGDGAADAEAGIAALQGRLADIEANISHVKERLRRKYSDELADVLDAHGEEKRQVEAALEALTAKAAAGAAGSMEEALADVQTMRKLLAEVKGPERKPLRLRVRARIKQLVSEIWLYVWDVGPQVRAAELHIVFHSGKVRGMLLAWKRRGAGRGVTAAVGGVLAEVGDTAKLAGKLLADYRTCAATRAFFDGYHATLAPALVKAAEAEAAALQAVAMASPEALAAADQAMEEARERGESTSTVRRAGMAAAKKAAKGVAARLRSLSPERQDAVAAPAEAEG